MQLTSAYHNEARNNASDSSQSLLLEYTVTVLQISRDDVQSLIDDRLSICHIAGN